MKKIHLISPTSVYEFENKYYVESGVSDQINEFSKYFNVNFICNLNIKKISYKPNLIQLKKNVKVNPFLMDSPMKILRHYLYYKRKLTKINKDEFVFILYPMKYIGLIISFITKKNNCILRVVNHPPAQFIQNGNLFTKPLRFFLKPIFSLIYNSFSKTIFKNNLVFYTSSVTTNKRNHRNQIEVISNSPYNRDRNLIKKEITNKIFFVGGEENRKGLILLLRALKNSNKELNIIGLNKFTRKRYQKLAQNVKVRFHGKVYDRELFYKLLSQGDILVMPSYGEKQGKVQLEAMSAGVVPICSDSGGTYRTIDNYYNGLLFKEGDYKQLRKQIELLYKNKELYERLKKNGLKYIGELSVEKQVEKMAEIINNYYEVNP